jgi:hypothetical protein
LTGAMCSGCSPEATEFGSPCIDAHLPAPRGAVGAPSSLVTSPRIRSCLTARDRQKCAGLKIGLLPRTLSANELADRLDQMACVIANGIDDATLLGSSTAGRAVDVGDRQSTSR